MIVKDYKEFTEEERYRSQKTWEEVLDTFCGADSEGCRPCDYGCPCDRCQYDIDLNRKYAETLISRGIPLSTREAESYLKTKQQ